MALTETDILNAALARIGAKRMTAVQFAAESTLEAIHCKLHYDQTRDALLRSHYWRFASARKTLTKDTNSPDFEWSNQFILPTDFLRMKSIYDGNNTALKKSRHSYALEGTRLLTDDSSVEIRYIRKVTDVTEFDPLFVEVLVLLLAKKLVGSLAGADAKLTQDIKDDLKNLMPSVRTLDRQETETVGRADRQTWVDVRQTRGGRIDSQLGGS